MRVASAIAVLVVVATVLLLVPVGCPDPCLLSGGCNLNSDCARGSVCRASRSFEATTCSVLEGTCLQDDGTLQAPLCGSVDDCARDECCDPVTNRCVATRLYVGPNCDEATCGDCAAAQIRQACSTDTDCGRDEMCSSDLLCSKRCSEDFDCGEDERCFLDSCSVKIGTPCHFIDDIFEEVPQERDCPGLRCVNVSASEQTTDPYCTDFCGGERRCPAQDFICQESEFECRRLF